MTLELPYPPSVNSLWRTTAKGGRCITYMSDRGKKYREAVGLAVFESGKKGFLDGQRLAMSIFATPPDHRKRDLDNICKAILDSLEAAGVFDNDEQVDELLVKREAVEKPGWVTVTIEEI